MHIPGRGDEPPRRRHLGAGEIVVALEIGEVDAPAGCLSLAHGETDVEGAVHFDGRAAALGVALGVVGIARGKQGALGEHRQHQASARSQLLYVHVAAVLPGRDRAQALRGEWLMHGHCSVGRWPDYGTASPQQLVLPQQYFLSQSTGRRHANGAHERGLRHSHAGQLLGGGEAIAHLPVADEGFGVEVTQESEAWQDGGEPPGRRLNVEYVYFQQVARLRAVDVDRARQGGGPGQG